MTRSGSPLDADLSDRLDSVERDTYLVHQGNLGEPVRINPVAWMLIAAVAGILFGRLAITASPGKMLVFLGFLGFTGMAVLRPIRALQLYLVLMLSGQASYVGVNLGNTPLSGPDIMLIGLLAGWALSRDRRSMQGAWPAGMAVGIIGLAAGCFAIEGLVQSNPWWLVRLDVLPFMHLLAFFPLVTTMREPGARRAVVHALALGLAFAATGAIVTFMQHRESSGIPVHERYGLVFPGSGPGGGARVSVFADALMPLGLLGGLALSRFEPTPRGRALGGVVATLCGLALLISYTRSLILPALLVLVVGALTRRRDPRRVGRSLVVAAVVLLVFFALFPLLSGHSLGDTLNALGDRFSTTFSDDSYQERSLENTAALRLFGTSPIVGRGFGAHAYVTGYPGRVPSLFHNLYAGTLAKAGAVGIIFLLGPVVFLLARARRYGRGDDEGARASRVAAAWVAGLLVAAAATAFLFSPIGVLHIAVTAALVGDRMRLSQGTPGFSRTRSG